MSMLVCIIAQAAVFMAADSRQYPSGADTVQKVFLAGRDAVVAVSGVGVIPYDGPVVGAWDAAKEVGDIAARLPSGTISEQLDFIQREVLKNLNAGLLRRTREIGGTESPHLAIMFVKREANGVQYCAHQVFPIISTSLGNRKWKHHAIASDRELRTAGIWWDVPFECPVASRRPIAPTRDAISAFINDVAAQSPYCRQVIGGPIRVGVVNNLGAHWSE